MPGLCTSRSVVVSGGGSAAAPPSWYPQEPYHPRQGHPAEERPPGPTGRLLATHGHLLAHQDRVPRDVGTSVEGLRRGVNQHGVVGAEDGDRHVPETGGEKRRGWGGTSAEGGDMEQVPRIGIAGQNG
jgi:hypothetical protein